MRGRRKDDNAKLTLSNLHPRLDGNAPTNPRIVPDLDLARSLIHGEALDDGCAVASGIDAVSREIGG